MPPTDDELMLRFAEGEDSAFVQLLQKFKPQLVEFAKHIVRDRETGEDIVQEAFLRVFRARTSYRPQGKFASWVYTITTNLCYDEVRKRSRQVSLEAMLGRPPTAEDVILRAAPGHTKPAPRPDAQAEQRELVDILEDVMQTLSPEHRQTIALRVREGLGYSQVAQRLGCSVGTAKSRMHYAMKNLRDEFMERM